MQETLRELLVEGRFGLVVPLTAGETVCGLLAVGERLSGKPFREEDFDYALALARQTQAALEGARLHQVALEKERQDRELQIAQEIQRVLFPRSTPSLEGFELAAESRPCHQVGGDYYDFIPLDGGRLGVVIADVSGKGTPASILMASGPRLASGDGGDGLAWSGPEAAQQVRVRQHTGQQVRHPLLWRDRSVLAADELRDGRPHPAPTCAAPTEAWRGCGRAVR